MIEIIRYQELPVEGLTLERGEGGGRKVRGIASVYFNGQAGTQYSLGENIVERIAPGAWDALLNDDCIACVNHDSKSIVGRNGKTLKLWTTARGLEYEIDLRNTSAANDLWENVQAGNIRGSSFKAVVDLTDKSAVAWSKDGKTDVLTIKRFDRLKDVSPVTEPAYKATEVAAVVRSLEEHNAYEQTLKRIAIANSLRY
jgi:HK97 family phage prohead protease